MNRNALYRACLITLGFAPVTLAADPSWIAPVGSWSVPANWSEGSVPAAGEIAVIAARAFAEGGVGDMIVYFDDFYTTPLAAVTLSTFGNQISQMARTYANVIQSAENSQLMADSLSFGDINNIGNHLNRGELIWTQNAGTVNVGSLTLSAGHRGGSNYTIHGGQLTAQSMKMTARGEQFPPGFPLGTVSFAQTGGASSIHVIDMTGEVSANLPGIATIQLSGGSLHATNLIIGEQDIFQWSGGAFQLDNLQFMTNGPLTMDGLWRRGTFAMSPGIGTLRLQTVEPLNDSAAVVLSIADNNLIIDAGSVAVVRAIGGKETSGTTNGLQTTPGYAVGYVQAADIFDDFPATWRGEEVGESAILVGRTLAGDATFDGTVNLADFNHLATNFGLTNKFWFDGDFDYDGEIDLIDFNLLAGNFGLTAAGVDGPTPEDWSNLASAVPEPSVALLGIAALIVGRRRFHRPRRLAELRVHVVFKCGP